MRCDEIRPNLAPFARNELDERDSAAVRDHLDSCGACRGELHEFEEVLETIARAGALSAPPEGLKVETLARVDAEGVGTLLRLSAGPEPPVDLKPRTLATALSLVRARGVRPALAWGLGAAAAVAVAFAAGSMLHLHDVSERLDDEHQRVELAEDQIGPVGHHMQTFELAGRSSSAQARLYHYRHDNFRVVLEIDGFLPSPPGNHYEMWMTGTVGQVSLGSFRLLDRDRFVVNFPVGVDPILFPSIVITLEPNDGNPAMSHHIVARSLLDPDDIQR